MKKKLCLALSGALCLSAGVGCGTETTEETLTPVRLNEVVHSVFYAPQYVAQELGFFEKEGLDVSVAVGNGADKSMTALLSDSADIALLGTEAGLCRREGRLPQNLRPADPARREFSCFQRGGARFPMV